nr:glycosyltransferase family 9 protein [Candidatus Delongbacteria bacterium]
MKFLVFRNGSIGNTVLATAFIRSLKTVVPDSIVDIVLDDWGMDLMEGNPLIRNRYCYRRDQDGLAVQYRLIRQWRREHYDCSFHLRSGTRNELLAWLSGIPRRIGFNLKGSLQLLTEWIERPAQTHVRVIDLYLLRSLAHQQPIPVFPTELYPDPLSREELEAGLLQPLGILDAAPETVSMDRFSDKSLDYNGTTGKNTSLAGYILLHPTGKTVADRGWNLEFWQTIISRISVQFKIPILIIASAQDRQIVADAFSFIPAERIISRSRIRDLMALIDHSRFFIGNDSGPAHIAEALGIPKLVI